MCLKGEKAMTPKIVRRILLSFFAIAVMTLTPLAVYSQCDQKCQLPPKKERGECSIVIDANTGSVVEGSIRIPDSCEQVQVYYVNKNPFKYTYSFSSTFVPFDQDAALSFLKLIPDFGPRVAALVDPPTGAAPAASACTGENREKALALKKRGEDLKGISNTLSANINQAIEKYTNYKNSLAQFFAATESDEAFRWSNVSCVTLCGQAKTLLTDYANLPDLDGLSKRVDGLEEEIANLEKDVKAFSPNGANAADCKQEVADEMTEKIAAWRKELKNYRDRLTELKTVKTTLDQKTKIVKAGDSDTFVEIVPAQRDDFRGGKYILTLGRKNLRNTDAKAESRQVTLLTGDRNLYVSAGVGFSNISDRKVVRQAALVPNGTGGTRLANVFGYEESSNFKPSGVFMLTSVLKRFDFNGKNAGSFGISTGLVLSQRNDTVEPEFIVGLTLGALRETVFFTVGFHAARRENLASGFQIGQEVPADLQGDPPTVKKFTGGGMFSITYRIK
jgi:hypothetical protein